MSSSEAVEAEEQKEKEQREKEQREKETGDVEKEWKAAWLGSVTDDEAKAHVKKLVEEKKEPYGIKAPGDNKSQGTFVFFAGEAYSKVELFKMKVQTSDGKEYVAISVSSTPKEDELHGSLQQLYQLLKEKEKEQKEKEQKEKERLLSLYTETKGRPVRSLGTGYGQSHSQLYRPYGVIAYNDTIIISDSSNHRVVFWNRISGNYIRQIGITGQFGSKAGEFNYPWGLTIDNEQLYVVEEYNHRVQVFNMSDGKFVRQYGQVDLYQPSGVVVVNNRLYISECNNHRITVLDRISGQVIDRYGTSQGEADGQFSFPYAIYHYNNMLYICDCGNSRIQVMNLEGKYMNKFGVYGKGEGQLVDPRGLCVVNGEVYVGCDDGRIVVFDSKDGKYLRQWANQGKGERQIGDSIYGLTYHQDELIITDSDNHRLLLVKDGI